MYICVTYVRLTEMHLRLCCNNKWNCIKFNGMALNSANSVFNVCFLLCNNNNDFISSPFTCDAIVEVKETFMMDA